MELNLCMGCMRKKSNPGPCPHCGFSEAQYQTCPRHLPLYTILNGKYLVGRVLGEGGFGITYIGYDLNLQMKVAIKEYYLNGYASREPGKSCRISVMTGENGEMYRRGLVRFLEEARRLARFWNLPGIVSVKDFFQENNTAYIVMEYIEGETLSRMLYDNGGKLSAEQVFSMMETVMKSLEEVHRSGLIHRDITPENLMVGPDGKACLIDFGASKDFMDGGQNELSVVLKPDYAPPEQYMRNGNMGPWTDVYGLCASMYRAIAGTQPPGAMDRVMKDTLKSPSSLGIAIDRNQENALMKGLAMQVQDRFPDVSELREALYSGKRVTPPKPAGSWKIPLIAVGVSAAVLVCAVGIWQTGKQLMAPAAQQETKMLSADVSSQEPGPEENVQEPGLGEDSKPQADSTRKKTAEGNVMMVDLVDITEGDEWLVLGGEVYRSEIRTVTFVDTLENAGENCWDVSEDQDGRVLAWTEENNGLYDLYIGAEGGIQANPYMSTLFACYDHLESIDFNSCLDTSEVIDMTAVFYQCSALESLDLSGLDTFENMSLFYAFCGCSSLTALDLSDFDTTMCEDMAGMFKDCERLVSLDVSGFDTWMVTDMSQMFMGCSRLEELDLSNFDISEVNDVSYMFYECSSLRVLDISNFDTQKPMDDTTDMFYGCDKLENLIMPDSDDAFLSGGELALQI